MLVLTPAPAHADHTSIDRANPATWRPVVFMVNGFGGCCIPKSVKTWLEKDLWVDADGILVSDTSPDARHVAIHIANWNDIDRDRNPGCSDPFNPDCIPQPHDFNLFDDQLRDAILALPAEVKVVLIGHSLGAEAVLRVAQHLGGRRVDFLGVLDAVGVGGLRSSVTSSVANPARQSVPPNVQYLFNRWQITNPYPLENLYWTVFLSGPVLTPPPSGRLSSNALNEGQKEQNFQRRTNCKIRWEQSDYLHLYPPPLGHKYVPYDDCIESQIKDVLRRWVFNPNPMIVDGEIVTGFGPSSPAAPPTGPLSPITGVRVVFNKPIAPATFTVVDVDSARPIAEIRADDQESQRFLIHFADPIQFAALIQPPFQPTLRLVIGPDIRDANGRQMDQDRDLIAGDIPDDQYVFESNPPSRTPDPSVLAFRMIAGLKGRVLATEFTFDRPVDPSVASDLSNYRLIAAGPDRRLGTTDDRPVPLARAVYDASLRTVTVSPTAPLAAGRTYRLIVYGDGLRPYGTTFATQERR